MLAIKPKGNTDPLAANDTTVAVTETQPMIYDVDSGVFHLAFDSQPVSYSLRSLAGLDSTKHYHYIIRSSYYSPQWQELIVNGRRIEYYSRISYDSIDYVGPYGHNDCHSLFSYDDSTVCDRDTLLFYEGIRNYIVRFPCSSDSPIDTIEISRDRVFRAEATDLYNKNIKGLFIV